MRLGDKCNDKCILIETSGWGWGEEEANEIYQNEIMDKKKGKYVKA